MSLLEYSFSIDQDTFVSAKTYLLVDRNDNLSKNIQVMMNITFPNFEISHEQRQIESNKEKWGSPNCITLNIKSGYANIQFSDEYMLIGIANSHGAIGVNNNEYSVESNVQLSIYYNINEKKEKRIFDVVSQASIFELNSSQDSNSIGEMTLFTQSYFENIASILFWIL